MRSVILTMWEILLGESRESLHPNTLWFAGKFNAWCGQSPIRRSSNDAPQCMLLAVQIFLPPFVLVPRPSHLAGNGTDLARTRCKSQEAGSAAQLVLSFSPTVPFVWTTVINRTQHATAGRFRLTPLVFESMARTSFHVAPSCREVGDRAAQQAHYCISVCHSELIMSGRGRLLINKTDLPLRHVASSAGTRQPVTWSLIPCTWHERQIRWMGVWDPHHWDSTVVG